MKNTRQERFVRTQRIYHKATPIRLNTAGFDIPELFIPPDATTSVEHDFSFVVNGRLVFVDWSHPRAKYEAAIHKQAWNEVYAKLGDTLSAWTEQFTPHYVPVGNSRKRVAHYTSIERSEADIHFAEVLRQREAELLATGIDLVITPRQRIMRRDWATELTIITPAELSVEADVLQLAKLARDVVLRKTTVAAEFPEYIYTREEWLKTQASQD